MNKIIFLVFAIFANAANATQTIELPEGAAGISAIENAKVFSVTQTRKGTSVKVEFPLVGCLDSLSQVTYKVNQLDSGKVELLVSAYNILNEGSLRAMCIRAPSEVVSLAIPGQYLDKKDVVVTVLPVLVKDETPLNIGKSHTHLSTVDSFRVTDVSHAALRCMPRPELPETLKCLPHTTITLSTPVGCGNKLAETVATTEETEDGKLNVYISSREIGLDPLVPRCLAFMTKEVHVKTIGYFDAKDINVVHLEQVAKSTPRQVVPVNFP